MEPDRASGPDRAAGVVGRLRAASVDLVQAAVPEDPGLLRGELADLVVLRRRVEARVARCAAALTRLEVAAARADAPDDVRAGPRAARQVRRELAGELSMTPSQVKAAQRVGQRAEASPPVGHALAQGRIGADQARVIDDVLVHLSGAERRIAQQELLAAACDGADARLLGRRGRALLARLDADAAERADARRHRRRRAAVVQAPDGMTLLTAQVAGVAGEVVHTAVHAFRRPDDPGERRTAEQATADALVAALRAALDGGRAPTSHGVRPHVTITVDLATLARRPGAADSVPADDVPATGARPPGAVDDVPATGEGTWTGPLPLDEVRRLLVDANASFVAVRDQVPIAVTADVRTVPAGLWRALALRDRGCVREGCDAPPQWCQVMHLHTPWARGGRLTLDNAALGCTHHHRLHDAGRLVLDHRPDGRPVLRPPPKTS